MKRFEIVTILFIGLGLLGMILSYHLGIKGLHNPGPGFLPFVLGAGLFIISVLNLFIQVSMQAQEPPGAKKTEIRISAAKVGLVLPILFLYALMLERVGYLIDTLLLMVLLFRISGSKWISSLAASFLIVLVTYFGFTYLGLRFPRGVFSF